MIDFLAICEKVLLPLLLAVVYVYFIWVYLPKLTGNYEEGGDDD